MNLSRSLTRSFALLLIFSLFLTGFSLFNFRRLSEADTWKTHTYRVLQESHRYYRHLVELDSSVRAYSLGGDSADLEKYQETLQEGLESWRKLKELTRDRNTQQDKVDLIGQTRQKWIDEGLEPIIEMRQRVSNNTQATIEALKFAPQRRRGLTEITKLINQFEITEESVLQERSDDQRQWQELTEKALWIGSAFSILLTFGLMILVGNNSKKLDSANTRLTHINEELENSNALLNESNNQLEAENAQRRAAEAKLKSIVAELERSNEELSHFAYVASHDLQEPLRAVAGCVQVLRKKYSGQLLDAKADQFIDHAVEGAQRMQNLINDLLLYSRVGTKGKKFEVADGNKVLDVVLRSLSVSIAETGVEIVRAPFPDFICDVGQIGQVFQNLISNAIKFRGEDWPRVTIGYRAEGENHIFSIRDNGPGIEPQYFERIFVMFQRLHTRTEYPGTGIGLAICKKIVERHGGTIWVESEKDHGSTFSFSLPMKPDSA